ncbi:MAG TPA: ABC transporter permease [Armatimonadota bacterium]|nr:ABC transporter permease [Armatimonadota bacterium]
MSTAAGYITRQKRFRGVPVLTPIGRLVTALLVFIGGMVELFLATVSGIFHSIVDIRLGAVERRVALMDFLEVVRQMQVVSWGAFWIAIITVSSSGMVIAMETVQQLKNFGMAQAFLGGGVAYATFREMAPVLTAVVATASVASSMTAQIASMKVTEQIDAIRAMGVDPIRYLVIPRVVAMTIMIPVLAVVADYCGVAGGFVIASSHQIAISTYTNSIYQVVALQDFTGGIIKAFVFGIFISLTACLRGMRSSGGAAGVGKATISSVVTCIILIYLFDTILTAALWPS